MKSVFFKLLQQGVEQSASKNWSANADKTLKKEPFCYIRAFSLCKQF